jgi:hypothetical protein
MFGPLYARSCYRCGEVYAVRPPLRRRCERCGADLLILNRALVWRQLHRLARRLRGGPFEDLGEPGEWA